MPIIWKIRSDGVRQRFNTSPLRPKIIELYKQGLPSRKVGELLGMSHARVLQLLEKEGVKRRPLVRPILNLRYKDLIPERAYILGVMCGDGCLFKTINKRGKWTFDLHATNLMVTDKDFAEEFIRCLAVVYGTEFPLHSRKPESESCKTVWVVSVKRKLIYEDLSFYKFGTENWEVPDEIKNSNEENIVGAFLRGYFDSEGSVSIGSRGATVSAYSINRQGLEDVRFLLLKLGIGVSEVRMDKRTDRKRCYYIFITHRNNYYSFLDKIGFSIKRKENALKGYIGGLKYGKYPQRAIEPSGYDI